MARLPGRLPTFGVGRRGIPDVIRLEDDEYIYLGTDNDYRIFCDSSGNFKIQKGTTDKFAVTAAGNVWVYPIFSVGSRIETMSSATVLRLKSTTGTGYTAIGSHSTNHSLDSNNDLLVSGELEVHGRSYFDNYVIVNGYFYVLDKEMLIFGPYGNACCIVRADSEMKQVLWSVAQNGGFQLVIGNKAYYMKDFNHPPQSNPTLFIHSATDPDIDNTEWMSLTHNQTDGVISTGKGSLKIDTGLKVKRTAVDTDYTTTESDYLIAVTDTSAPRTITLASATCTEGKVIIVKDESGGAGTNNITIATEGSETIDGAASVTISTNYGVVRLYSDGANWFTW